MALSSRHSPPLGSHQLNNARRPHVSLPLARRPHLRSSAGNKLQALPTDSVSLSYIGLGTAAATFVATFFVAPRLFTKNPEWTKDILPVLRSSSFKSLDPKAAYQRAKKRQASIVDVRLPSKYEEMQADPSINVPLYIPIQKWDLPSIIRRVGFASFGVYGTELNPDFVDQAKDALRTGKELMVLCENGGSIEAKAGNDKGFQSRSLKAIYYLLQGGVPANKIAHIEGGIGRWTREGLPVAESVE